MAKAMILLYVFSFQPLCFLRILSSPYYSGFSLYWVALPYGRGSWLILFFQFSVLKRVVSGVLFFCIVIISLLFFAKRIKPLCYHADLTGLFGEAFVWI